MCGKPIYPLQAAKDKLYNDIQIGVNAPVPSSSCLIISRSPGVAINTGKCLFEVVFQGCQVDGLG